MTNGLLNGRECDTAPVPSTILVCTDGSELAAQAAAAGLAILQSADRVEVVTVADIDATYAYDGSGHAGPTMTEAQWRVHREAALEQATGVVQRAARELGIDPACGRVLEGVPGPALCDYAHETSAGAIVIGTRGRGGIKRALLGSVSDFVVRNAPCPVVVVGAQS
jgi:nucleotide-binding universal stress UspA family protein